MKELKGTIDLMLSNDYGDRFVAEYQQTKIRYEKLSAMLEKYYAGKLEFEPDSPVWLLEQQRATMRAYLNTLEARSGKERISLANHKLRADVKVGTKVRLKRDLNAASGILPKGAVAIIALKEDDELMLFFSDHLVNSDTKLLHIYRSEIGGNDYEVMTDAQ